MHDESHFEHSRSQQTWRHNFPRFVNKTKQHALLSNLLIAIWTHSCCIIIFRAINIWTIIKSSITFSYRSSSPLVEKMPMKASKWSMVWTFVLKEVLALLSTKLFQVPRKKKQKSSI